MLIGFTAMMMVGCGGEKKEVEKIAAIATNCKVCSTSDNHIIEVDSALILIAAFHNVVLKGSNIANSGGYFTLLRDPSLQTSTMPDNLSLYRNIKFHWGLDNIIGSPDQQKRLFITLQGTNNLCSNQGIYSGTPGIENRDLMTADVRNDIPPFVDKTIDLTTTKVLFELMNNRRLISYNYYNQISSADADRYLQIFSNDKEVGKFYTCDDLVFDRRQSLDEVIRINQNQQSFFYFFGYDKRQDYHRLRLIMAGYDANNKIVFYDATGLSLLRENSRPRP